MTDFNNLLSSFFSKQYENEINESLFIRNYKMNDDDVRSYIQDLIQVPMSHFIEYVISNCSTSYITYQDVVQYSSFEDASTGICKVLSAKDNNGLTNIEVGSALLNDGKVRKDGALRKYGENHAKTGMELGLVQSCYSRYYLTCLGVIFNQLDMIIKNELVRRTILRNRFFQKVIKKSQLGPTSLIKEMSFLSDSTAKRRMPNVRNLYTMIFGTEQEVHSCLRNIYYYEIPKYIV